MRKGPDAFPWPISFPVLTVPSLPLSAAADIFSFALPYQIAHGLVIFLGNKDIGQFVGAMQARKRYSITAVILNPLIQLFMLCLLGFGSVPY